MTVIEKQNVTLPCRAAGFPQPVITRYKNGHLIEDEQRKFKKSNLEIKGITFEDRGIYTCTAENLLGRVELMVNVNVKGTMYTASGYLISNVEYSVNLDEFRWPISVTPT